jgi:hypothetical protein
VHSLPCLLSLVGPLEMVRRGEAPVDLAVVVVVV